MKGGEYIMRKKQIGVISASIFLFSIFLSPNAFADTEGSIHDNGGHSSSQIEISESHEVEINQHNETRISNDVQVENNTGGNTVGGNTHGETEVHTGNAAATVTIENTAGVNSANVSGHGESHNEFEITNNGYRSSNRIEYDADHEMRISQSNETEIDNRVEVENNTGNNSVRGNTRGEVVVETGDADADINISNTAGANVLHVTGGSLHHTEASIKNNGSKSHNKIEIDMDHKLDVNQRNDTEINNTVDVNNNTGNNSVRGDHHDYDHNYDKDHDYDLDRKDDHKDSDKHDHDKDNRDKHHMSDYDKSQKHDVEWMKYTKHEDRNDCDSYKPVKHDCDCDKKHATYSWYLTKYPRNNDSGNVSVKTGNANATVTLTNSAGYNWLSI